MIPSELFIGTGQGDDFEVPNSLRFRSSASAYLSKTYSTSATGAGKTFTWSSWIKRGTLGARQEIFNCGQSGVFDMGLFFTAADEIQFLVTGGTNYSTTLKFRDVAGWYHIQLSVDTTTLISTDRIKLFVNGNRITSFTVSTTPTQNFVFNNFMSGITTNIGRWYGNSFYFDGYLAEIYAIDGQALTPDNFGTFNSITGQWVPKKYSGSYGTNGFYLDFKDAGAVANLGYDKSGNNNHWTPTNISLTAGVTYDSMLDSPTNNFATFNPIFESASGLSNGNLSVASSSGNFATTPIPESGKWYFEITVVSVSGLVLGSSAEFGFGWRTTNDLVSGEGLRIVRYYSVGGVTSYYSVFNGVQETNTSLYALGAGTVLQFAIDCNAGTVDFYSNGIFRKTFTGMTRSRDLFPTIQRGASSFTLSAAINFGQRPFAYTPPTGFQSLCSKNLPTPSIKRGETGFDVATYTGNGGNIQIGEYQFPRPNYLINRSLRFKASATSYLTKVIPNASGTTATFSLWIKRTTFGGNQSIFGWTNGGTSLYGIRFINDQIDFVDYYLSVRAEKTSTRVFRDSNWHHFVCVQDTTNATAGDRFRIYVDGQRITSFSTSIDPAQNIATTLATNINMQFGYGPAGSVSNFDGYMAEINFIDGQALTADNFGEFDINGYWIPKAYTGTYGTNGFYLPFSDNSALTTTSNVGIGKDFSGNGNYWTTNNISLTAGSTYDSMIDSPTNNIATLDALTKTSNGALSNGNLTLTSTTSGLSQNFQPAISTFKMSGKMYFEWTYSTGDAYWIADVGLGTIGFNPSANGQSTYAGNQGNGISFYRSYGYAGTLILQNNVQTTIATSYVHTDTLAMAYDRETGKVWGAVNGVWVNNGNPETGANPIGYINEDCWIVVNPRNLASINLNCGQRPFTYTPPTGFKSLTIPNIAEYTSDLESPDLVWIKSRSAATNHMLFDSIRGAGKFLSSNTTTIETTNVNSLVSFNKNGFYLGNNANVNTLNNTYVSWMWKKGTTKGFDIATITPTGYYENPFTVNHNLGVVPSFIIAKNLNLGDNWWVYHSSYTNKSNNYTLLNTTGAVASTTTAMWGTGGPTSTAINVQNGGVYVTAGLGQTLVFYLFAEIEGYSKFGSYTGNGSADGPFIYCGFKPRWIMVKRIDTTGDWLTFDNLRSSDNAVNEYLYPNLSNAEGTSGADIDFVSNGFKLRNTGGLNTSSATYIYAAFAETTFKYATAR